MSDRRAFRARMSMLAAFVLAVACMQPRFGERPAVADERGVDLVLCLDVSRSMLAEDLDPSRLARARRDIVALTDMTRGDRLGLVAFAGEPVRIAPLTLDVASVAELAGRADPWIVRIGGTELGAALDEARALLESGRGDSEDRSATELARAPATIVLLTDGADPSGAGRAAASRCREAGVTVHCVGYGSPLGSKIRVVDPDGREAFVKDRDGNDVVSRLDAASLRAIAEAGGGAYVAADTNPRPLTALYAGQVLPTATARGTATAGVERPNRYRIPLSVGLLALLATAAVTERRRLG